MVYEQFDKAFSAVTAYAVLHDGEAVGRVVLKHGAAVSAYVQMWGAEMAKGQARGGGYDRATAAVCAAIAKLPENAAGLTANHVLGKLKRAVAESGSGERWTRVLESAGFTLALVIG